MNTKKYKTEDEAKAAQKKQMKEYYEKNKAKVKARAKEYYIKNKDKHNELSSIYREENKEKIKSLKQNNYQKNKEKINKKSKEYYIKNKSEILKKNKIYQKNRCVKDSTYNIRLKVRNIINKSFYRNGYTKISRTHEILGCTYEEFKQHLENQFESWMGWNNRGLYNGTPNFGWDIDHIIPLASATCEADVIRLNHYTNLRPLCSYTNRVIKRDCGEV
jgi:hypothetical protein